MATQLSDVTLDQLYNVGLHYGHKKQNSTPMARDFIYAVRENISLIDLSKTKERLGEAIEIIKKATADGQAVLFVGTKKQARPLVAAMARSVEMPFVANRWLGGMLTNFKTIRKSLDHLEELEKSMTKPEFTRLKKREQKRVTDEIAKLHRIFDGITTMTKLPDILFVIDTHHEAIAIQEAKRLGITTIGIVDTDGDPTSVDWAIPANDDAPRSLKFLLNYIGMAVADGKGVKYEAPAELEVDFSQPLIIKKQAVQEG